MKFRTTAILLAVGLAAGLFYFLVEKPRDERLSRDAESEGILTRVAPEEVETLTVERADHTIAARRDGAGWRMTSPVEDSGDAGAFNTLILSVCGAAVERRIETHGEGLSEYGLDPPAAILRLSRSDGRVLVDLRIGEHNVTKSHCYATFGAGPTVLLIPSAVRRYSLRPLFEYRNPRIVEIAVEDVSAIGVSSPGRAMEWRHDRPGRSWFTVESGDTISGDSTAVQALIRELRGLRARDIPAGGPENRDRYLEPLAGSVVLGRAGDTEALTLRFGAARDGACYVERSNDGRISLVDTTVLDIFGRTLNELRDRKLVRYADQDLYKVALETPGRNLSIVRSGPRWTYANPGFGDIGEESGRNLLALVRELKCDTVIAEKIPAARDYGFSKPSFRLVLFDEAGRAIDEVRAGTAAPGEGMTYVTSLSAPYLASISESTLSALESRFTAPGAR